MGPWSPRRTDRAPPRCGGRRIETCFVRKGRGLGRGGGALGLDALLDRELVLGRLGRPLVGELGRRVGLARHPTDRDDSTGLIRRDDLALLAGAHPDPDVRFKLVLLAALAPHPKRRPALEDGVDLLLVVVALVVLR